jgi:GxxExxY protein
MDTDSHLVEAEKTHAILGAAFEVLNELGHGLHEKPYENALTIEFDLRNIPWSQQSRYTVTYKGYAIAEYVPDLVVFDSVIVDIKVVDRIGSHEKGQMMNYLRITGLRVGLILNFSKSRLEWERVVL